jgi:hypothetical protein
MPVSDFTREICKVLCIERGVEMEIARLKLKEQRMVRNGGMLTETQKAEDEVLRAESGRMFDAGRS